jgi:arylsulfatase A-like enzyme
VADRLNRARRLARTHRVVAAGVLGLPAILVVASDAVHRGGRMLAWGPQEIAFYVAATVESVVVWGVLLGVAARRRGFVRWLGACAFLLLATLALGTERYFYDQYATYMNVDAVLFGAALPRSLLSQIRAQAGSVLRAAVLPLLFAIALVALARCAVRPSRRFSRIFAWLAIPALSLAGLVPCSQRTVQASTPDVIWFRAMGGLLASVSRGAMPHVEPGLRHPDFIPMLSPSPRKARNVLLVMAEGVRFDAVCVAPDPVCKGTPFTNQVAAERLPLLEVRANTSTTAIALGVIWSGLRPTETRDAIHTAPLIFDYARAAGYDTAYLTSQHMMFASSEAFVRDLPVSHRCGGADLDPNADIDMGADDARLTARAVHDLAELKEPWFAVVQYSSTHFPYRVSPDAQPFQPASESKSPEDTQAFFNHYRNAVYLQDRNVADLIRAVRETHAGPRTVVVYTSDHGEAFRDHDQLGHTGSVFDEEIHVPTWIDAPPAALTAEERASIAGARNQLVWQIDMAPTLLDLLGIWQNPEIARHRARMAGHSLLGPERTTAVLPLTNCTELWGCAFRNWGVMKGTMKLEAREWDFAWHCWNVGTDPLERRDLGPGACADLAAAANAIFGGLPKSAPDMPERP